MDVILVVLVTQAAGFFALGWRCGRWLNAWTDETAKAADELTDQNIQWHIDKWRKR